MAPGDGTARDCLFCAIVAGESHAARVLEDDDFVGFLDIRPLFRGHVLLVPRTHVVTLPDLPAELRDGFVERAQRLATAMVDGLGAAVDAVAGLDGEVERVREVRAGQQEEVGGDGRGRGRGEVLAGEPQA